jgi:sterol desaturase/sphingolipid hydroxylase (fatty acid hydroxylase superfamily)
MADATAMNGSAGALPVDQGDDGAWPSPVGLSLGILAVLVGQVFVLLYHYVRKCMLRQEHLRVQLEKVSGYDFLEGLVTHASQPEGFVLLGLYLSGTWMFRLMPDSYYSFEGGVNWWHVAQQLLLQDALQTLMHLGEHRISAEIYKRTHKPHHKFLNPRLFDAFNGSTGDTVFMILIPLFITAQVVHCNVWSYMTFGTLFANYLVLIHSEYSHPWDPLARMLGIGTAGDHHVHHRVFVKNFGHLFTYWDRLLGTYQAPTATKRFRGYVAPQDEAPECQQEPEHEEKAKST